MNKRSLRIQQTNREIKMKFSENSDQAAGYLRQAVPAMVKYEIVPNPLNYTLWYSYYSNAFPALNKELDQTIKRYGTCPTEVGEALFIQHITQLDKGSEKQLESFHKAFSHMVDNLSISLDKTAQQTTGYSQALMDNLEVLGTHEVDSAITPLLTELSKNASAICSANEEFQGRLTVAQTEINSLRAELEQSKKEANTDPLTGLSNRRVFESIYHRFVEESGESEALAMIIMDIDKFKIFNDTHGHLVGDQILKFVGHLLRKECKYPLVPVRFGGEEFALLCPRYDIKKAQQVAESIRVKLSSVVFNNKRTGDKIPPVTASFGVAIKKHGDILNNVIERADQALYAAKSAGRNQVMLAN
ncbi:MAG: diguanylate cyclase [Glaciecola sp.]|jgi:diguanylate cyclase